MKKILMCTGIVGLVGLTDMHAQHDKVVWKNDPTYSVYNYKHPNKAAAAKALHKGKATELITLTGLTDEKNDTKVMIPKRRIVATEKTRYGRVKTPLAVRRKTSEKFSENIVLPENTDQLDN